MDEIKVVIEPTAGELGIEVQPSGVPGPPGSNGLSAYEVAEQNGFVGTVAEWLESLIGEPGADGARGTDGMDGADGYTPVKGVDYFTADDIASIQAQVLAEADSRYANALINTASGSGNVLIPDAWDAPIQDMTVLGGSVQSTTKGVQLFDASTYTARTIGTATLTVADDKVIVTSVSSTNTDIHVGAVTLYSAEDRQYGVEPNTTYYLSNNSVAFSNSTNTSKSEFYVGFFNNATHLSYVNGGENSRFGFSFTTPDDCNKIVIRFGWRQITAIPGESMTVTKVMLNKGATALPWEPYTGGIPSPNPDYPQPITSVENPMIVSTDGDGLISTVDLTGYTLRGIDDVRDRIERRDGVWGIERNVTEYTTNGSDIKRGTTNDPEKYRWTIDVPYAKSPASYDVKLGGLCNGFQEITASSTFSRMNGFGVTITTAAGVSGRTNIYWEDWAELTLEDVKATVAQNPITFILPRETTAWEPFPAPIQQQFNNLRTYRGDNSTAYIVSEIAPDISVTYIQDSNKVVQQLKLDMAEQEIDVLAAIDQLKIDNNLI